MDFDDLIAKAQDCGLLESFPDSRLRIFLSLDFSGSTDFKQGLDHGISSHDDRYGEIHTARWVPPFSFFHTQIDRLVNDAWNAVAREVGLDVISNHFLRPKYWKPIGDEVVYQTKLLSPIHVILCVKAWKIVTERMRGNILYAKPLNVKGAAWLAGFPVNNSEFITGISSDGWVKLPEGHKDTSIARHHLLPLFYRTTNQYIDELNRKVQKLELAEQSDCLKSDCLKKIQDLQNSIKNLKIDYMGPQMDLGFRVAGESTPRKMMLSLDILYFILACYKQYDITQDKKPLPSIKRDKLFEGIKIGYEGRKPLKGVRSRTPYPLFWMEIDDNLIDKAEEKFSSQILLDLGHRKPPSKLDYVLEFTLRYLVQNHISNLNETNEVPSQRSLQSQFLSDRWLMIPFISGYEHIHETLIKKFLSDDKLGDMHKWHKDTQKTNHETLKKYCLTVNSLSKEAMNNDGRKNNPVTIDGGKNRIVGLPEPEPNDR
ncbi:MAG: hypothetical protein AB8B77_00860 [Alphaproteobacteria bacterium]